MNKYKYLANNTIIFFIGSFASKVLTFFLLPLYTTVLTTSEYAISDLMNSSVNLLYMILTLMISEAVLRFSLNDKYKKSEVLNIGVLFIIISSVIVGIGTAILSKANVITLFQGHWLQFLLLYIFYSFNSLFSGFIRGIEKVRLIAVTGVISTILTIGFNILFLVVFDYGIDGYINSMIISNLVSCFIYYVFGKIYKYKVICTFKPSLMIEMVKYSSPIVVTQVAWWINSGLDKYMVTWLMGPSEAGLLSVAYRLPSVLRVFTGIFMQAWKLSAIKEYKSESSKKFFSNMLNLYNAILIVGGAIVIILVKPISSFIFRGDFASAWYIAPPYILAFVINSISSFLGSFYMANGNTKSLMGSTLAGAFSNIILNYLLIKKYGTIGAGIATVISYFIISIIRTMQIQKEFELKIDYSRIIFSYLLLITLTVFVSLGINYIEVISIVIFVFLSILNFKYIMKIIKIGISFVLKR